MVWKNWFLYSKARKDDPNISPKWHLYVVDELIHVTGLEIACSL